MAAELVVGMYLEDSHLTQTHDGRQAFSVKIMENGRFLYENPFNQENKVCDLSGAYAVY